MRECTTDGCHNAHRARGLCSTCYNLDRGYSKDHTKIARECAGCGVAIQRDRRYADSPAHCSELCRQWAHFGAWSSVLPRTHWARMFGSTSSYKPPKPGLELGCAWCGETFTQRVDGQRFCNRACKTIQSRRTRKARQIGAPGTYSWAEVTRLWMSFDKRCAYCSTPTPLDQIQAEHVQPLAEGGRNDLSNLLPSCGPCNSDKRDLPLDAWNADRARRGLVRVKTTWDDHDTRYAHLLIVRGLAAAA